MQGTRPRPPEQNRSSRSGYLATTGDLELVYRVEVEMMETAAAVQLYLPQDCDLLAAEIKRLGVAMVALDPLMSALDPSIDTHNDRDLRTALEPLGKMADDTGCMITGLAHFNKSATDDPLTLVTGSRAFTAVVRSVVAVARDPEAEDGTCVISQVKNNLGQLDLPNLTYIIQQAIIETDEGDARVGRLHFTGESEKSVRDILAEAGNGVERTERAECADWLRQALAAPCRTKEIEDEGKSQGFSQRTQYRVRKQLGVKAEQVASGPKGRNEWWLSLPAEAGRHDPAYWQSAQLDGLLILVACLAACLTVGSLPRSERFRLPHVGSLPRSERFRPFHLAAEKAQRGRGPA